IAAAKKINKNADVIGILCGEKSIDYAANEMIYYGADSVVIITHDHLKNYTSEGYSQAVMAVIEEEMPYGIVMGHTAIGKDLTPKIASKLEVGLISDVIEIEHEDQTVFTRPIYSGKAFEKKTMIDEFVFVTIRPN